MGEEERIDAILIWGSYAKREESARSDVDICIVAPGVDPYLLYKRTLKVGGLDGRLDIKIFELLPLYLKMEVIRDHEIIYARDRLQLYEYFYFFRKLWADQERRQRL
jgi:hypothetical protein